LPWLAQTTPQLWSRRLPSPSGRQANANTIKSWMAPLVDQQQGLAGSLLGAVDERGTAIDQVGGGSPPCFHLHFHFHSWREHPVASSTHVTGVIFLVLFSCLRPVLFLLRRGQATKSGGLML
jgi:hypothetical protein